MSTTISNTDCETFILPIDINKYGALKFNVEELELRVTNDFIEISGQQEWRMCFGGADRISFQRRHVLPEYIDPNSVLCRLMDDSSTILVTAPYQSLVSKIDTNHNRPTIDYVLGLDDKGMQYLKRYNAKNSKPTVKHAARSSSQATRQQANDWLHQLIKNNESSRATATSKLFASIQGQRNIDLVDNLMQGQLKKQANDNRIHLDVKQLLLAVKKTESGKQKRGATKKAAKDEAVQGEDEPPKNEAKKKRRTRRKKKSPVQTGGDQETADASKPPKSATGTEQAKIDVAKVADSEKSKTDEPKLADAKESEKKEESKTEASKTEASKIEASKIEASNTEQSKVKAPADKTNEPTDGASIEKQDEQAKALKSPDTATSDQNKAAPVSEKSTEDSQSPRPSRTRSVPGLLGDSPKIDLILNPATASGETLFNMNVASLFAKLSNGGSSTDVRKTSDLSVGRKKKSESESDAQRLPSALKSSQDRSAEQLCSKIEKHVVIADY